MNAIDALPLHRSLGSRARGPDRRRQCDTHRCRRPAWRDPAAGPRNTVPGYPAAVRTDNGPGFTSRAFIGWAQSHGIRHNLIEPGRPMQNGYIESFNGRFRDECLNEHWFETLGQARTEIAAWRRDHNEVRPHGSIGRIPPAQFARRHRRQAIDSAGPVIPITKEIQQPSTPGLPTDRRYGGWGQVTASKPIACGPPPAQGFGARPAEAPGSPQVIAAPALHADPITRRRVRPGQEKGT